MSERPWCCPEPRCTPILNMADGDYRNLTEPQPGRTIFCWGTLDQPVEFVYDGIEHSNDRSFCVYTALKGAIRFQLNDGDLGMLASGFRIAVDR